MSTTRAASHNTDPISEAIAFYESGWLPRQQRFMGRLGMVLCAVITAAAVFSGWAVVAGAGLVGVWVSWMSMRQNQRELDQLRVELAVDRARREWSK